MKDMGARVLYQEGRIRISRYSDEYIIEIGDNSYSLSEANFRNAAPISLRNAERDLERYVHEGVTSALINAGENAERLLLGLRTVVLEKMSEGLEKLENKLKESDRRHAEWEREDAEFYKKYPEIKRRVDERLKSSEQLMNALPGDQKNARSIFGGDQEHQFLTWAGCMEIIS